MSKGKLGVSTGAITKSPARYARERLARKRQEKRWARKGGPVTTRFVCPICGGPHARADHVT